jgi:dipeptidase E
VAGRILAMGGSTGGSALEELLLELSCKSRPRICFLDTASAHNPDYVESFFERFRDRSCEATHLQLFGAPERPGATIAGQDIGYVAGGNTANALAIWRVHGVDRALREVWERGGVLGGWSAGGICWFEDGLTDSFGPQLRPLRDGLGFLTGSFCPHFDGEPLRRPVFLQAVREGTLPPGHAADDDAALLFEGTELREAVSQRPGALGYRVEPEGEEPLETRLL